MNTTTQTTLTADQVRRLERLRHYSSRYELAAVNGDRKVLVSYTDRISRRGLIDATYERRAALAKLAGSEEITFAKWDKRTVGTINGWTVRLTGRTQREAIISGELPFLLDLVA